MQSHAPAHADECAHRQTRGSWSHSLTGSMQQNTTACYLKVLLIICPIAVTRHLKEDAYGKKSVSGSQLKMQPIGHVVTAADRPHTLALSRVLQSYSVWGTPHGTVPVTAGSILFTSAEPNLETSSQTHLLVIQ